MPKKKEIGTRQPELQEIIDALEDYREQLFKSEYVSATKFHHMQGAIHNTKNVIRQLYGAKLKSDVAWVK